MWLQLSASSAALDLALSQSPGPESQINGWTPFATRHRHSQHSLPQNIFNAQPSNQSNNGTSSSSSQQSPEAIAHSRPSNRHSMEATLASFNQAGLASQITAADGGRPTLANIQSSYSTNDIPTMKSVNGAGGIITPTKTQAQQQFHNHNASLGRIPLHALNNRHSRELSGSESVREEQGNSYHYVSSGLQASAAPFGPATVAALPTEPIPNGIQQMNATPYSTPAFYGGYGVQLVNMGMTPVQMANPLNYIPAFQPQPYTPYQTYGQPARFHDSQARVIQQRRIQNGEGKWFLLYEKSRLTWFLDNTRFTNVKLEHLQGEIYGLCKDQHGCRYLQKKLEERNPEHVHIIFLETNQHVVELMTGTAFYSIS